MPAQAHAVRLSGFHLACVYRHDSAAEGLGHVSTEDEADSKYARNIRADINVVRNVRNPFVVRVALGEIVIQPLIDAI